MIVIGLLLEINCKVILFLVSIGVQYQIFPYVLLYLQKFVGLSCRLCYVLDDVFVILIPSQVQNH